MQKIINKIAIKLADGLNWSWKKALILVKFIALIILTIGKFTLFPIILFTYKRLLFIRLKAKNIQIKELNYLVFIKKYLPGTVIVIIIVAVTTNNIFAQSYSTDEYANRTLLSALIANESDQWSELVEESGPAVAEVAVSSYLEDQGSLQELVINTPFEDIEDNSNTLVSPDESSLVLVNLEDDEVVAEQNPTANKRDDAVEYIVQPGDVIGKIAEKYNVTVNTILWENDLTWNSTIRPGQKLTILPNSGINHEVASGDTVLSIAKKYQTDADKIVETNKLADASDIKIGDLLFIPNGVRPTQVVSSYKPRTSPVSVYSDEEVAPAVDADTGTKLLWPVLSHRITQYYHWGHSGLDIGDKTGNPIYAAEAGKVERSGWSNGYGYNVIINHGNGIKTLYAHASKLLVEVGDTVSRGETIALIGSTGWSTGPHLHMEVRVNEVRKNPLNYIK